VTKRRDLIKTIKAAAKTQDLTFEVDHEGGRHTVFSLDGLMIPIGRHAEIDNQMAEIIYKECTPKLGRNWWRR
jgi:hypothetical protein